MPFKLARVSYNDNNYSVPSGNYGKCSMNWIGGEYYEWLHRFGWEEWNKNELRVVDNYQYGFLQAINNDDNLRGEVHQHVVLFTKFCNPDNGILTDYIVGFIGNLEALSYAESTIIRQQLEQNGMFNQMQNNVFHVDGNVHQFNNDFNRCINMRFQNNNNNSGYYWGRVPREILCFDAAQLNQSFGTIHNIDENSRLDDHLRNKITQIVNWIKNNPG